MKKKRKIQVKAKNKLQQKLRLVYTYGIYSLLALLVFAIASLINFGTNKDLAANVNYKSNAINSVSDGSWGNKSVWYSPASKTVPEGNMKIEIYHSINSSRKLDLSGKLFIYESGKLVIDELTIKNGGELFLEGELYVNKIAFEKGCFVNMGKNAALIVNETFLNKKKSDNINIDGNVQIFGNCYNEKGSEIYGEGKIIVAGNFVGTGLEYSISPIVEVAGEVEQKDKDPINLLYFRAYQDKNTTILNWVTEFENNNSYFTIERSYNGVDFKEIGQIYGSGFSSNASSYTFMDKTPIPDKTIFYRLKQTSFDGISNNLNVIVAETGNNSRF